MCDPDCRFLERVVERYDTTGRPVCPSGLAGDDTTVEVTARRLAALESYELVAPAEEGYRPTVTARELLDLDVDDDDLLVIDTDSE